MIIKLTKGKRDYYFEWSEVVDAPVTKGMSLEQFKKYYQAEYGKKGIEKLAERLARVEEKGCSHIFENLDEFIKFNRAGDNEKCLTKAELIKKYCR